MAEKIKPCPFCGAGADVHFHSDPNAISIMCGTYSVECRLCTCVLRGFVSSGEAIERWNRREAYKEQAKARDEFMGVVYDELSDDADNCRANRIIDAADEYAESLM